MYWKNTHTHHCHFQVPCFGRIFNFEASRWGEEIFTWNFETSPFSYLLKKTLWHRCFPVNFAKFSRTSFLQNTSGRLLLNGKRKKWSLPILSSFHRNIPISIPFRLFSWIYKSNDQNISSMEKLIVGCCDTSIL